MDIKIFTEMLNDKAFTDNKKMKYKYSEKFKDFLEAYTQLYCEESPLYDFWGKKVIFAPNIATINQNTVGVKTL